MRKLLLILLSPIIYIFFVIYELFDPDFFEREMTNFYV